MSGISHREELLRTFRQEPIDRIPVSPFIHVNHVKEFFGSHDVDWVTRTPGGLLRLRFRPHSPQLLARVRPHRSLESGLGR